MKLNQDNYDMSECQNREINQDSITLLELLESLWDAKKVIVSLTFIFAFSSVILALSLPNIYKANAILSPADAQNTSNLGGLGGQLGGLAAMAGVNLGASNSGQTQLAVEVMYSRRFVNSFINKHDLLVPLMAAKGWDASNNKLELDEEVYDSKTKKWVRTPKGLRGEKPTAQEAYEKFVNEVFSISQDKESGSYNITILHYSPYIAKEWVNLLVEDINFEMRSRALAMSSKSLKYLNEQLEKTTVAEMQSTLFELIKEQTKNLMLANVQYEFVFKVIDPAVVPEVKSKPSRAIICIMGTLIGFIVSLTFVFVRFVLRKDREKLNML